MTPTTKPSAGAMKAAEEIDAYLTSLSDDVSVEAIARIIDDNGMRNLAEALVKAVSRQGFGNEELIAARSILARYHGKENE